MPDQDNIQTEKISLSSTDFADDLGSNTFGIQDTQILASKDLQSFLLSDPDKVKDVAKEGDDTTNPLANSQENKQKATPQNKQFQSEEEKNKVVQKEEKEPNGGEELEKILFGKNTTANITDKEEKGGVEITDASEAGQSADDETYATLAKDFLRLGVFTKNSDDETEENITVKTPEEFLERFSLEKKKGAIGILDNFLSQFGDEHRKMFDAVFVNGVKPQDYLNTFTKIEAIKNLDITSEPNQERIVKAYYKGLNWDDTKIEARVQKLKDYGDLEDEAKSYQEILLNKENEKEAELVKTKETEKAKIAEKETSQKNSYTRILKEKLKTQEVDGIPLNEKEAQATLDYLTEKKYKLESGELLSEFDKDLLELNRPENHEQKVKLGLLLRKKLDLSSVKKATISKKSDQLFTLSTKNAKQNQGTKEMKSFF